MITDANDHQKSSERPPPIFVSDVTNYTAFSQFLKQQKADQCLRREIANKQLVLTTKTVDEFRNLQKVLSKEVANPTQIDTFGKISFHTYQLKSERAFTVYLRHLPRMMNPQDIKEALELEGFSVRHLTNVPKKTNGIYEPLPLFKLELEPNPQAARIYELKYLLQVPITVESPKQRLQAPQCLNCQAVGHTKAYCSRPPRCVKCGSSHNSSDCKLPKTEKCTCANCGDSHPANYRGCPAFIAKKKKPPYKAVEEIQRRTEHPPKPVPSPQASEKTFTEIVRHNLQPTPSPSYTPQNDHETLASLHQMMKQMTAQLSVIPDLTARIKKLEQASRVRSQSPEWITPRSRHKHRNG